MSNTASPLAGAQRDVRISPDDGDHVFTAAYVEARRWNGWACPWFTEDEALRIAAMTARWRAASVDGVEVFEHDPGKSPPERFTARDNDSGVWPVNALPDPARPGEWVYGLGNDGWTWEEEDE